MAVMEQGEWRGEREPTPRDVWEEARHLRRDIARLERIVMSNQSILAAEAVTLSGIATTLQTTEDAIVTEIAALQAAAANGQPLDFGPVNTAIGQLLSLIHISHTS